MKSIWVTYLFTLLCVITTMNSLTNKLNNKFYINNFSKIINEEIKDLPHYNTVNNIFENLNIEKLRKIQKYIVNALICSKMFDRFKFKGKFQLLIDDINIANIITMGRNR